LSVVEQPDEPVLLCELHHSRERVIVAPTIDDEDLQAVLRIAVIHYGLKAGADETPLISAWYDDRHEWKGIRLRRRSGRLPWKIEIHLGSTASRSDLWNLRV
jgi:hypothetical protein